MRGVQASSNRPFTACEPEGNPGREPISGTFGGPCTGTVTATLTFGGIASGDVAFAGVPGSETVRFVLLGSDEIRSKLSTGRYEYDIVLRDAQDRTRKETKRTGTILGHNP
jgi:hypothetical protein